MNIDYHIILASQSPRRQQLLKDMGFQFEVRSKNTPETFPDDMPVYEVPAFLAQQKAYAFSAELTPHDLVITADTVVIHENKIFGKPTNEAEAYQMIRAFSGQKHSVVSGITIMTQKQTITRSDQTDVYFEALEDTEIQDYIHKYQPFDKAGAYGIQEMIGMIGVRRLEGSYFNVMGLPTHLLWKMLKTFNSSKSL